MKPKNPQVLLGCPFAIEYRKDDVRCSLKGNIEWCNACARFKRVMFYKEIQ